MPKVPLPSYLHPDYDPMRDKMDRLREILIHNRVKTPSGNVRKQDFVDLFELHIRPQIPALRRSHENVVASEEGIIKVPASSMTSLLQPKAKAKTTTISAPPKPSRTTSTGTTISAETAGPSSQRQKKDSGRSRTSTSSTVSESSSAFLQQHSSHAEPSGSRRNRPSNEGIEKEDRHELKPKRRTDANAREPVDQAGDSTRGRKARASLIVRGESDTDGSTIPSTRRKKASEKKKARSENFSDENPFQSGSESERRRRSKSRDDFSNSTSRPSSKSSRSRTRRKSHDEDSSNRATATSSTADRSLIFKVPAQPAFSQYMHTPKYSVPVFDRTDLDSGAFHDSPLLAKSRRISAAALSPPKPLQFDTTRIQYQEGAGPRRYGQKRQKDWGPPRLVLFFAALVFGMWYRHTRFQIGYCTPGSALPNRSHAKNFQQHTFDWIYPTCIPCPTHATCLNPHEEPICPQEYILKPHPLNPGNILPLTPVCVLNKAREYQSLQVADVAEHILHRRAGSELCKQVSQPKKTAELVASQRISVSDLKSQIESMKDSSISPDDFEQYWSLALKELHRRTDTIVIERGIGEIYMRSLKPSKPLVCRMRQGLVGWFLEYQPYLLALAITSVTVLLIRRNILKRREEAQLIQGLVDAVLGKLADQSHYYYIDPVLCSDPYLPQIHLRDALLADMYQHQPARRQEIWEKVSAIVDRDANVRVSAQEVRGEIHRVWEWIGASGVLSGKAMGAASGSGSSSSLRTSTNSNFRTSTSSIHSHTSAGGVTGNSSRTGGLYDSFYGPGGQDPELTNPSRSLYPSLFQD